MYRCPLTQHHMRRSKHFPTLHGPYSPHTAQSSPQRPDLRQFAKADLEMPMNYGTQVISSKGMSPWCCPAYPKDFPEPIHLTVLDPLIFGLSEISKSCLLSWSAIPLQLKASKSSFLERGITILPFASVLA